MKKIYLMFLLLLFTLACSSKRSEINGENVLSAAPSVVSAEIKVPDDIEIVDESSLSIPAIDTEKIEASPFLEELTKDTWAYISLDAAISNHLPWSWYSESLSGGDFANPAEIGFYALSWLAAYDRQASWSPNWVDTEMEVTAVLDQLRAWQTGSQTSQPHGPNAYNNKVFYQWYWISWNPPVVSGTNADHLVPSIDNAWLAASLITIREYAEANGHDVLATKASNILSDMDFRLWYDSDTSLFSWGDIENPLGAFVADNYSNENRIINFVARATGQLTPEEFQASLDALSQPTGTYGSSTIDKMAYDGSYFTYASPALFIQETTTDYGKNTIDPATAAQIAYADDQGYDVWGLSDSYDVGDAGYVQQGALPTIATGSPETRPGLVTPHASALALTTLFSTEAETNLQTISTNYGCAYHSTFGFRDSIMANPLATDYGQCSNRFSVLAQEWIFLSLVNHEDRFVWRYFYRDSGVLQAHQEMFGEYPVYLPIVISD